MMLKKFGPQELVCPHIGAIYKYINIIFKDLPHVQHIYDSENKIDPWVHLSLP